MKGKEKPKTQGRKLAPPKVPARSRAKAEDATPSLGEQLLAGLTEFHDHLKSGRPLEEKYTVRTYRLDVEVKPYGPEDVKAIRERFGASQALFARFLGVSAQSVRNWEQGTRPVPGIACRFLDELAANPELWKRRLRVTISGK